MAKHDFAKEFDVLIDDFNIATQRAIAAFNKNNAPDPSPSSAPGAPSSKPPKPEVEIADPLDADDIFTASLDQLQARVVKCLEYMEDEYKDVEKNRKAQEKKTAEQNANAAKGKVPSGKTQNAEELNAEILKPFSVAAERAEKALEGFTLRVRSQLVGRKDLGDKFTHAANNLFVGLKKLDAEVDKFVAAELKRKPRLEKEIEVMPSKFLSEFKDLLKKNAPEDENPKVAKAIKDVEDRLKRIDTNNGFDKVTSLCEAAQSMINELMKQLGKDEPKLTKGLKDLHADIAKYDDHMFLLSRMR